MRVVLPRIGAWLVDWLCILAWAAVVAAVGVPLYLAGVLRVADPVTLNVVSAVLLVVPVVLAAAALEAGGRCATPGKRLLRLTVARHGGAPGLGPALLRNVLKIGLPWLLGHAAVFLLAGSTAPPPPVLILVVAAYVLPAVYLMGLLARGHRPLYDRLSGTDVAARSRTPSLGGLGTVGVRR